MVQKQQHSAESNSEPKKRRRVGFSTVDAGVEANECIKIYLVSSKDEVDSPESICMNPVDLNSFFDEDGKIFGYQDLKISVWVNIISFRAYADITYKSTPNGAKGKTDLESALQKIFAETLVGSKDEFLQTFSTERDFIRNTVSNGEILQPKATNGSIIHFNTISKASPSNLEVVRMVMGSADTGLLYSRLIPLVLLFVDGSNPIDVTDPDWELYLLIHKTDDKMGDLLHQLVGFAAVYRFYRYPDRSRLRLSQILVLPTCQKKGYGSYLVEVVNDLAVTENVYDLTVEEPSEDFQHIRTCIDITRLLGFDPIKPAVDTAVQTLTQGKLSKKAQIPRFAPPLSVIEKVRESLKINKKQFLKCWEILIYLGLDPIDKYIKDYTSIIANHVRADVLGKDSEGPGKQLVDVPSPYEPESSFAVFKSGGKEASSNVQMDENQPDQEQQLKQLVEERIQEIKLVAEKASQNRS